MKLIVIGFLLGLAAMAHAQDRPLPDFDSLWNYDEPAQTEAKFRALLPSAEDSRNTGYLAELMTQIARALGLQQKFDAAHAMLDSVKTLLPAAGARADVRYLLERGRVNNSSKQPEEGMKFFVQAWEKSSAAGYDAFSN